MAHLRLLPGFPAPNDGVNDLLLRPEDQHLVDPDLGLLAAEGLVLCERLMDRAPPIGGAHLPVDPVEGFPVGRRRRDSGAAAAVVARTGRRTGGAVRVSSERLGARRRAGKGGL